jgi:hypothetical protein
MTGLLKNMKYKIVVKLFTSLFTKRINEAVTECSNKFFLLHKNVSMELPDFRICLAL